MKRYHPDIDPDPDEWLELGEVERIQLVGDSVLDPDLGNTRLAQVCAYLDPDEEQALADQGLALESDQWPLY